MGTPADKLREATQRAKEIRTTAEETAARIAAENEPETPPPPSTGEEHAK